MLRRTLLATLFLATPLQAQVDQQALARELMSGDPNALAQAQRLGRGNTGPDVRAALIALLEKNNQAEEGNVANPEFVVHVAHTVSQLGDPAAIPALAGALGSGSMLVRDALAEFGDRAAPEVLRVVTSPASHYSAVDQGLIALRFMAEGHGGRLSPATLDRIRGAAMQRLTGRQYFTTLWQAIDLAIALNDAELRQIVESLAASRDTVAARGIVNPLIIERTQTRATTRLAVPRAAPTYRSLAERDRLLNDPR